MRYLISALFILCLVPNAIAEECAVSLGIAVSEDNAGLAIGFYSVKEEAGQIGYFFNGTFDVTPNGDVEHQDSVWFPWHDVIEEKVDDYIVNSGLTLSLGEQCALYSGVGLVLHQSLEHYASTASDLDYWVRSEGELNFNFNAGAILRFSSNNALDLGFNSGSQGFYVSWAFFV